MDKEKTIENRELIEIEVGIDSNINREVYLVYNKTENYWNYHSIDIETGEEYYDDVIDIQDETFIQLHENLNRDKFLEVKEYIEKSF